MPKKDDQKLLELRRQCADQRKQIDELLRQIAVLQEQLREALAGNAGLKKQLSEFQQKLDELLFQINNLTPKEYGQTTEHHNPRQGPGPDSDGEDDSEAASKRLKSRATKENRPRNHKKHINEQDLPAKEVPHAVKPEDILCPHCQK